MRTKRTQIWTLVMTAVLLVGCEELQITWDEAIAIIAEINEYYESDDFVLPTKYATALTIRNASSLSESETIFSVNYDYEARFLHINLMAMNEGVGELQSEQWFYYEDDEDKTYTVADSGYDKYRIEVDGNVFADILSEIGNLYLLENMYERLDFSSIVEHLAADDSRNIYRSEGEGYLDLKFYFESDGFDTCEEIVISNYLIMKMEVTSEKEYFIGFVANYGVATIDKPNLDEFPLAA